MRERRGRTKRIGPYNINTQKQEYDNKIEKKGRVVMYQSYANIQSTDLDLHDITGKPIEDYSKSNGEEHT